jgi:hypothetical protein
LGWIWNGLCIYTWMPWVEKYFAQYMPCFMTKLRWPIR